MRIAARFSVVPASSSVRVLYLVAFCRQRFHAVLAIPVGPRRGGEGREIPEVRARPPEEAADNTGGATSGGAGGSGGATGGVGGTTAAAVLRGVLEQAGPEARAVQEVQAASEVRRRRRRQRRCGGEQWRWERRRGQRCRPRRRSSLTGQLRTAEPRETAEPRKMAAPRRTAACARPAPGRRRSSASSSRAWPESCDSREAPTGLAAIFALANRMGSQAPTKFAGSSPKTDIPAPDAKRGALF